MEHVEWTYDDSQFEEKEFDVLPIGNYRARIEDVDVKRSKAGNQYYQIEFAISGHNQKIWHNLTLLPDRQELTNQKLREFFNAFHIIDRNLDHYDEWIGHVGALKTKHEFYNDKTYAKVHYFIRPSGQEILPDWEEPSNSGKQLDAALPDEFPF